MLSASISRRQFTRTVGAAAAAFAAPRFLESVAHASLPEGMPATTIQLDSNENPYGPSPKAIEAIAQLQGVAGRYPDGTIEKLRQAIARLHGVEPSQVALGCGSTEILRVADMAFLSPERNVVVAEPTFEAVLDYARVTRGEPVKMPLTPDFCHDLPRMAAACTSKTGLVYICNPNNPTGTIVTREELAEFFKRVPVSTMILVDEAYHHYVEDPRYASAFDWIGRTPNLIVTRTFSKVYGLAGMRLGYAVASRELIRTMSRHLLEDNVNAAVLSAALASLGDDDHVARQRRLSNDARQWLCAELAKDGRRTIPSQTNFVMIEIGSDVRPVIEQFRSRGILVGRRFPSLGNWLRVSIGTRWEMEAFLAAFRAIVPAAAARAA
jgi:histidinol-phosphate aminotransferase